MIEEMQVAQDDLETSLRQTVDEIGQLNDNIAKYRDGITPAPEGKVPMSQIHEQVYVGGASSVKVDVSQPEQSGNASFADRRQAAAAKHLQKREAAERAKAAREGRRGAW